MADLDRPDRGETRRRAFKPDELEKVWEAALADSNDPELDLLLLDFHLETGARLSEGLGLTLGALDFHQQIVRLGGKNDKERDQPVTADLLSRLHSHAIARGAEHRHDRVLRNRRNQPTSKKRYESLWKRVRSRLGFAERSEAATHSLRKTAATMVERVAGRAVSEAFLGHTTLDLNSVYTKATPDEVADALVLLTGKPHPEANFEPQ